MNRLRRTCVGPLALLAVVLLVLPVRGEEEAATPAAPAPEQRDPAAAKASYQQAEAARIEERWKDAADLYWKAVEADRTLYDAHVRYQAVQVAAGGGHDELVADYDSFVKDFPADATMRLHRLRLEEAAKRLPTLEEMNKATPKVPDILLEAGRAHLEAGDAARAAKLLADALSIAGTGRTDIVLLLARAEAALGRTAEARRRLEAAVASDASLVDGILMLARLDLADEMLPEAIRRSDVVLASVPAAVAAGLVKSEAQARAGDLAGAIATLEALRGLGRTTPNVLVALGDLVAREGTEDALKAASDLYAKVLAEDATNGRALYGMAWVLERQGKIPEAEAGYRKAVNGMPGRAAPVDSVGWCLLKQGRISDAQVQFKKAIDIEPKYPPPYANLGATFDAQANYGEAIRWYEKLLKIKGQEESLRALVNLAFDHEALGSFPKGEGYLRRARKQRPDDSLLATWLGDNLYFQEKMKDAEKAYQEAVALDAKNFFAHRGLGYALGRQKRWPDAVAALEKARELKPEDQDVLVALGDIYLAEIGDLEKALKAYEAYVQAGGQDEKVRELIVEIRKQLEK